MFCIVLCLYNSMGVSGILIIKFMSLCSKIIHGLSEWDACPVQRSTSDYRWSHIFFSPHVGLVRNGEDEDDDDDDDDDDHEHDHDHDHDYD